MPTATTTPESQITPVYFPADDTKMISELEEALPGYPKNFLLLESIKAGYKTVIKKLKNKPVPTSFTEQVSAIVKTMMAQDITTESVKDALLAADPNLAEDKSASAGLGNISKVLERLSDRGVIKLEASDGRKKIYRLAQVKAAKKRK